MGVEDLLDLAREELLAAAVDHLLEAADDAQASVGVDHAEIAAAEPAVGQKRFRIGGRIVVIAEMHRGAIAADLALLARRHVVAVGVDQPQPHMARGHADRAGDAFGVVGRAGIGLVSRFQHPQQLEQHAGRGPAPGADGLDRRRGASAHHNSQAGEIAPARSGSCNMVVSDAGAVGI